MSKPVRKKDLKDQTGTPSPRPILICSCCGGEYSAHAGDYFMMNDNDILKCCEEPLQLVVKSTSYQAV